MKQSAVLSTLLVGLTVICVVPVTADEVRVVTWNVSNYSSGRVADFQTAIYGVFSGRSMSPDIFVGQEFLSASGVTNFLSILNTAPGSPGDWAAAAFIDGPDTDNALFYRTSKAQLATDLSPTGVTVVAVGGVSPNHPRNITRYDLRLAAGTSAETTLAIYSSHMKASTGGTNQARRLLEAQRIRDDAEALPAGWHFLLGGDFNIRNSTEGAYVEMVGSQVNNDGRLFDPIKTPGNWHINSALKIVHSQAPGSAGGGMDDRFDQILVSGSLVDGVGLDYIGDPSLAYSTITWDDLNHSYRSWGNDGTSFDLPLTITGNLMVGSAIAQALVNTSLSAGHLPVFLDLLVPPCPADFECDGDVDLADHAEFAMCISGPAAGDSFVTPTQMCLDYFDLQAGNDVDLADFQVFQQVFGG